MQTQIQPVSIFPDTATTLSVLGVQIRQLGDGGTAFINWQLLSADGRHLKSGVVEISGEEYDVWGTDDSYILGVAVSKLGLTQV